MKILVIDSEKMHRDSARKTLEGHDLTVVSSFAEAMDIMKPKFDKEKERRLMRGTEFRNVTFFEYSGMNPQRKARYHKVTAEVMEASWVTPKFDVVLTDMMNPSHNQDSTNQSPFGFLIVLRAAKIGTKHVAMVTDKKNEDGGIKDTLVYISTPWYQAGFQPNFEINGAKVLFTYAPLCTDDESKDWGQVLKDLLQE